MRRQALICTVVLLPIASAAAQRQGAVHVGPFAAINYTTFAGPDASFARSRTDVAIGGQLDYSLDGIGFLRTGLLYSRRGTQGGSDDQGGRFTAKLSYFEVPVLLGYAPSSLGGVRPFVMAGGHIAFKLPSTCQVRFGLVVIFQTGCETAAFDMSSTDVALLGGGGVLLPLGKSNLSLDVRYALGLTNVASGFNARNRGFTFGAAYMFPLSIR